MATFHVYLKKVLICSTFCGSFFCGVASFATPPAGAKTFGLEWEVKHTADLKTISVSHSLRVYLKVPNDETAQTAIVPCFGNNCAKANEYLRHQKRRLKQAISEGAIVVADLEKYSVDSNRDIFKITGCETSRETLISQRQLQREAAQQHVTGLSYRSAQHRGPTTEDKICRYYEEPPFLSLFKSSENFLGQVYYDQSGTLQFSSSNKSTRIPLENVETTSEATYYDHHPLSDDGYMIAVHQIQSYEFSGCPYWTKPKTIYARGKLCTTLVNQGYPLDYYDYLLKK